MKLIKEWKRKYYEFKLVQDKQTEIIHYAIYIKIPIIEWNLRTKEVENNFKSKKPKKSLMRDIAESWDCWWISIEHLKAIRDFIHP